MESKGSLCPKVRKKVFSASSLNAEIKGRTEDLKNYRMFGV